MNGEEEYELANDKKYEKQVREALRSLEALKKILQTNKQNIVSKHYTFYYYFMLKGKMELLETIDINGLWEGTDQELKEQKASTAKEIEEIRTFEEDIETNYQIATKRIGTLGDPYGIGEIARRVQFEIKSKSKEGLEESIGEEPTRE